jgi:hypothetical protein
MSRSEAYLVLDEPQPTGLARHAVNPVWPLFGMMFAGAWFAWLWFLFNGYAIGSPTRRKELLVVAIGLVGLLALPVLLVTALTHLGWTGGLRYAIVVIACWKVGVCYWLYFLQSRSFELYEYYGGVLRSGMFVVIGGYLLSSFLARSSNSYFVRILLS